ncbi:type II toxin-antitoxin system RelE/ParE family toxin [Budvicia diplopodorum]|uniref:type II toxin-antitoxin system RelE/ParE family toxin n=1 Tax=Budvicia diplopodorum TaxID=1119056 RepID=UPI002483AD79|nr:type II toxin-antitoxin system RelE/ParE family toxin [Budvicia diplopodorum]
MHRNMKELRVLHKGCPIRALFAFDLERRAVILCVGNKEASPKRFYTRMIPVADAEFTTHLQALKR